MTQVLFYGCLFITFSPILAFFFLVIAKNSQLVILTIGGSFFWLLSILLAAIWWYIIPSMKEQWWFIISFSVLFQEIFRYIFFRLYSYGFNDRPSLNQIKETQQQMVLDAVKKRKQIQAQKQLEEQEEQQQQQQQEQDVNNRDDDNIENKKDDSDDKNGKESTLSYDNDKQSKKKDKAEREIEINARLETLSARPNHVLSSAAIGVGSGIAYGFIMFGSILWESTGPGTLFSPACPTVNLFMLSSIITLFMTILHVIYNVLAFQGYRSKQYHLVAYVIVVHFLTTYLTLLNQPKKNCIGSVLPIAVIAIFSVGFSLFSLLRSDSIKKIQ